MTAFSGTSPEPAAIWRLRELPGRLFDFGVVFALLAVGAVIALSSTNEIPHLNSERIPLYLIVLVPLASLLVRRRLPLVTFGVILAALIAESLLRSPVLVQPLVLVGVYTIAARTEWRVSLIATVATAVVFLIASGLARGGAPSVAQFVSSLVTICAAYVVGSYVRTRVAYIDSLQQRAAQLLRERELLAQQAVAEERVRIARELHDVVAHHLSLLTVQAGALQTQLAPGDPARDTAESMARTGRKAMDEMRRMLGVLRLGEDTEMPEHMPQPGIGEIPRLVAEARDAGLDVSFATDGAARPVPPGIDLSAYRIVQEALTNVLRHAGSARCSVTVRFNAVDLELRVTDDARGSAEGRAVETPSTDGDAGHGLVGMRERVALFGGELFTGAVPGGGFAVRAVLPLPPDAGVADASR
jgi:signal transduction histidine kinase